MSLTRMQRLILLYSQGMEAMAKRAGALEAELNKADDEDGFDDLIAESEAISAVGTYCFGGDKWNRALVNHARV